MYEWVAIGSIAVSLAAIGLSTYYGQQQLRYQQQAAKAIEEEREVEAKNIEETSKFESEQSRRRAMLMQGKLLAVQGAAGIDTSSGSPLLQLSDLVTQNELESLSLRRGFKIQAGEARFESGISRFQKEVARAAQPYQIASGALQGAGAALSGASDIYAAKKGIYQPRRRSVVGDLYDRG